MQKQYRVPPRWRSGAKVVVAAVMIALSVGSTRQAVFAQARDFETRIQTVMEAGVVPTLCAGETRSISVRVIRTIQILPTKVVFRYRRKEGILVVATAKDATVSIAQPVQYLSFAADGPGEVKFDIHAVKAGTTSINFHADVTSLPGEKLVNEAFYGGDYVESTVPVKVIYCDFQVTSVSTFAVPTMEVTSVFENALLNSNAAGEYSGEAMVRWVGSWTDYYTCHHAFQDAPTTTAHLTGDINDNGELLMHISYEASSATWDTKCGGQINSDDAVKLNPSPAVELFVPVSQEVFTKDHVRLDLEMLSGESDIKVVRINPGGSP